MNCDGSGHQGSTYIPISWRLIVFHLRGENITKGFFASLNKSHEFLTKANRIVLAGSSIGGIAALQWANSIQEQTEAPVYAIADGSAYLSAINIVTDHYDFESIYINTIKLSTVVAQPPCPTV